MIIEIKHNRDKVRFGTHLTLEGVNKAVSLALQHNKNNVVYSNGGLSLQSVFNNIIDEFKFLSEFDIGHSIADDNVDVTYMILHHSVEGLMVEAWGNRLIQPIRLYSNK